MKLLAIIMMLLPLTLYSQNRYSRPHWSAKSIVQTSSFLSDLGGKNGLGTNDFADLDLEKTNLAFGIGAFYSFGKYSKYSFGFNAFYTNLAADDRLTKNDERNFRQLSVNTDIFELNVLFEYTFPANDPVFANFFFNVGAGICYYEPKAEYNGVMYKLRPLGTEGQNYIPGKSIYPKYSPMIPFGIGKKFPLSNGHRISVELAMRKSFTDYLDDASTDYADPVLVGQYAPAGTEEAAAYFANPSGFYDIGRRRADPREMDNYFLIGFRYELPLSFSPSSQKACPMSFSLFDFNTMGSKVKRKGKRRRGWFK